MLVPKLVGDLADEGELRAVYRGVPHNVTNEMDLALWELAVAVRGDTASRDLLLDTLPEELAHRYQAGSLPRVAQDGLASFLARYGHHAVAEIDIGVPRWSEDPTYVLGVLVNHLRVSDPEQAPDRRFARAAAEAEATVDELVRRLRGRRRTIRARLVGSLLRRARALSGLRELPKSVAVFIGAHQRRLLLAVGEELVAADRLTRPDDVFFLDLAETRAALGGADHPELVAGRRAIYQRELRRRHAPLILLSDGTQPEAAVAPAEESPGVLTGRPTAPGK